MAELFDKKEFRALRRWFLTLDMTRIRSNAFDTGAINHSQKQRLEALARDGPQTHNDKLLDMVREADSRVTFKSLAEAVKELGEDFEPKYDQMMAILDLGKGQSQAAVAPCRVIGRPVEQECAADLFENEEYQELRMILVETMDMDSVRNSAEGFGLITALQVDDLRTTHKPQGRLVHNRELFRLMEVGGPPTLKKFGDKVLRKLGPHFAESKAELKRLCGPL